MARIRSVKPEFWTDRKLARLSRDARLLYIALWNQSDEWCRVHGDTRYVKGHCLPYDDDLSLSAVDRLLDELATAGHLVRYLVSEDPYLYLPKLARHQRLEPFKVPSRLPEPPKNNGAETYARRADESARDSDGIGGPGGDQKPFPQVSGIVDGYADTSARGADTSERIVVQQVAGSREQVAGGRWQVGPQGGAQTLIAEWLDSCRKRPPDSVVGQVAKLTGQMLAEGIDLSDVRAGLIAWASKGVHPAVLPSVVNEVMNGRPGTQMSTTDLRVADGLALVAHYREQEGA